MPDRPAGKITVALSRQRGSGGSYVGQLVAQCLGLRYFDRELLRDAAAYLHGHDPNRKTVEQPDSSWWSRLGNAYSLCGPDGHYVPPSSVVIYEGDLFEVENQLIREIVDEHVAVIVGRGAAQILRGRSDVITVFVHAPEQWRVGRIQQVYHVADRAAALRIVRDSDRDRARFIRTLSSADWTDARGYTLAVDTAALGFDAAADLIVRAATSRIATGVGGAPDAKGARDLAP